MLKGLSNILPPTRHPSGGFFLTNEDTDTQCMFPLIYDKAVELGLPVRKVAPFNPRGGEPTPFNDMGIFERYGIVLDVEDQETASEMSDRLDREVYR